MHRAILSLLLVACGAPLGEDENPTVAPPASALPAPAPPASSEGASDPVVDVMASCMTSIASEEADTMLALDATGPRTSTFGAADGLNATVGMVAFRFAVEDLERAVSVTLHVDTNSTCAGCGDAGLPAVAATATVYAARSDWDESSADAFRRTATGAGWGRAPTASSSTKIAADVDYGASPAGSIDIVDGASSLAITLDVTMVRTWTSGSKLTLLVHSPKMLVLASRESARDHARLSIKRC